MENKISIIIPVYNVDRYLSKCIDSVILQKYENWELILVNDGSTDNSAKICDYYSSIDSRIVVVHKRNEGPSKARNYALNISTGNYILFIDSDDWIDEDTLSNILMSEDEEIQPDIVYWGFRKIYDEKVVECIPKERGKCTDKNDIDNTLNYLFLSKESFFGFSVNKLFKSSIIKKYNIHFKEDLRIREDELFTLEYCNNIQSIAIISKAFYNYRILKGSLSHKSTTYVNYDKLSKYLQRDIVDNSFPNFVDSFKNRIFDYRYNSIQEMIKLKKGCSLEASRSLLEYYRKNTLTGNNIPKWFRLLFSRQKVTFDAYILLLIIKTKLWIKQNL